MLNTIKESIKITNENIVLATPLILFSLLSTVYMIFSNGKSLIGTFFTIFLFFLMFCAFISGWFFMASRVVKEPDVDKNLLITQSFFAGVGEYFLQIIGFVIIVVMLSLGIYTCSLVIGKYFIGNPGITYNQVSSAIVSVEAMKSFLMSLSNEQLIKINLWNLLLFAAMLINYFLIMFFAPAMYFKNKNPFSAFFISLKDLFSRKFFQNCGLYIFAAFGYFLLSILTAIFSSNIIAHFILTLLNFYFASFVVILVFNYYYSNFAKIGSNIDKMI